ncbi:MAG: asparagine synthase-related protein [Thiobacillaceae bacterium]
MNGLYGWLGHHDAPDTLHDLLASILHPSSSHLQQGSGVNHGIGLKDDFGRSALLMRDGFIIALHGRPSFKRQDLARLAREQSPGEAALAAWREGSSQALNHLGGSFSLAVLKPDEAKAWLAIDPMGIERLCFATVKDQLVFSTSASAVASHPAVGRQIDLQAIYDFFYFHVLPSPGTLYQNVEKLLPGELLSYDQGKVSRNFYWTMDYTPDTSRAFPSFREAFRSRLTAGIEDRLSASATGAFLSGGTDSSTVVGALTAVQGRPAETFSIGFDAEGFDEMEYARIAARQYASHSHEYYLKPADIVSAIPIINQHYDEPFGNDSAVPAYYCAKLAREHGIEVMLGGDGGDEIFGGNARYAKQKVFEAYFHLPGFLRQGLIEPLAHLPFLSEHLPVRKLRSYVDQANVRLPDRLETYNFLHRSPLSDIFEGDFRAAVDPSAPARHLREVYERTNHPDPVKRMMHIDLKFTLADNDLRKVVTMCEAAGVEARFPLLDDDLVSFSGQLPPDYLVKGLKLRWFFKEALRDLLPEQIINKRKHGFGLPFGPWSVTHEPLRELVGDSLASLSRRGWVRKRYLDHILHHQQNTHASYYGVMIWVSMILEQWLEAHHH